MFFYSKFFDNYCYLDGKVATRDVKKLTRHMRSIFKKKSSLTMVKMTNLAKFSPS
jgi:hypothetical protein